MTKSTAVLKAAALDMRQENTRPVARLAAVTGNPSFSDHPLDGQQLSSIYAVLSYVAHGLSLQPDVLQVRLETEFGVQHMAAITSRDFSRAVDFLLALRMDDVSSRR